jgi:sporulation protein YlmC with PRC-barrel domain
VAPPPLADNLATDDTIEPENVPDVPPVGAATGVESIAFTPVIQEDERVAGQDDVIDHDFSVWATDGEIGRLSDVRIDGETRRITGFGVQKGVLFHHEVDIPRDLVAGIRPGTIVLTVEKASLAENGHE